MYASTPPPAQTRTQTTELQLGRDRDREKGKNKISPPVEYCNIRSSPPLLFYYFLVARGLSTSSLYPSPPPTFCTNFIKLGEEARLQKVPALWSFIIALHGQILMCVQVFLSKTFFRAKNIYTHELTNIAIKKTTDYWHCWL